MLAAFLTTLLFSLSVTFAARSVDELGAVRANLTRMAVALVALGIWAHVFGQGLGGETLNYFLVSGCIGFGLGDLALFQALSRIGPRLTILLAQCLAAPIAVFTEWAWMGTVLRPEQLMCGAIILAGVAIALFPEKDLKFSRDDLAAGVVFGVLAAVGQALGAVISRRAYQQLEMSGVTIDAGSAAYQRMLGGILLTLLFFSVTRLRRSHRAPGEVKPPQWRRGLPWAFVNGLVGPGLGVACYQWALSSAPSGVVLPIVATTPVVTIPLAHFVNGDTGGSRSVLGGVIAVGGAIGLSLL